LRATGSKRGRRCARIALAAFVIAGTAARAETITLRWRHAAPERAAGFRVHLGSASGDYTRSIDLGHPKPDAEGVFRAQIEVADGAASYLAISAYDANGNESRRSNEWARGPGVPPLGRPGRPQVVGP
jgi:hypothetical protein